MGTLRYEIQSRVPLIQRVQCIATDIVFIVAILPHFSEQWHYFHKNSVQEYSLICENRLRDYNADPKSV